MFNLNIIKLHDLVLEAAETERRMPEPGKLAKIKTYWPDIKAEWLAYAPNATTTDLARATSHQISEYDWLMEMIGKLGSDDRRMIWMTAHSAVFRLRGPAWAKLSRIMKIDRRVIKKKYQDSLIMLLYLIKRQP